MKTSPNQREVLITREIPTKTNKKPYLAMYCERIEAAATNLTPVGFKLYLYLASNQDGYNGAFSSAHFSEKYGCDVKSAKTAFNLLIDKGYLTQSPNQKNLFIFNELPQTEQPIITLPTGMASSLIKKNFKDEETGQVLELTLNELIEICGGDAETANALWEVA